jgi:hypothetical protein
MGERTLGGVPGGAGGFVSDGEFGRAALIPNSQRFAEERGVHRPKRDELIKQGERAL